MDIMMTRGLDLVLILGCFATALQAYALPLHETLFSEGIPTSQEIEALNRLPGVRTYRFLTDSPPPNELERLMTLKGYDRVQVVLNQWPRPELVAQWRILAKRGFEIAGVGAGIPNDTEVTALNEIEFPRVVITSRVYPVTAEGQRITQIKTPVSVSFNNPDFPKYAEREGFYSIPSTVPLLFVTNYWPGYFAEDVLNFFPQPVRLRIVDTVPTGMHFEYLHAIKRLVEVTVETDFDPIDPSLWKNFAHTPVHWLRKDGVPSPMALQAFSDSAGPSSPRRLTLQDDVTLTSDERARLVASPVEVDWDHTLGENR
jgi:hypothetical protein